MKSNYTSRTSIQLNNSTAAVWKFLLNTELASKYFHGAQVITDWKKGNPILFKGEFNGNKYEEKGTILAVVPESILQYSHWSGFDGLPDLSENYRTWSFELITENNTILSVSEDNIPTEKQQKRSDEFWTEVLNTIKQLLNNG